MELLLGIWLVVSGLGDPLPWHDLALSIEEDRGFSSDHATLCLVRVVNHGRSTWNGSEIGFEARAIRDGRVAARQRGRFGLTLGPHESLETRVAFIGRYDRLEVEPRAAAARNSGSGKRKGAKRQGKSHRKSRT
jgi:hypothetical protein